MNIEYVSFLFFLYILLHVHVYIAIFIYETKSALLWYCVFFLTIPNILSNFLSITCVAQDINIVYV